jgi:hypothetical protein
MDNRLVGSSSEPTKLSKDIPKVSFSVEIEKNLASIHSENGRQSNEKKPAR